MIKLFIAFLLILTIISNVKAGMIIIPTANIDKATVLDVKAIKSGVAISIKKQDRCENSALYLGVSKSECIDRNARYQDCLEEIDAQYLEDNGKIQADWTLPPHNLKMDDIHEMKIECEENFLM